MRIDLHTHSTVSDGTDSPTRLVMRASAARLAVIGLTDHDTFDGLAEAMAAGARFGVTVLPGVEISCQQNGREVHLLGYGVRTDDADLNAELALIRNSRNGRLLRMIQALQSAGVRIGIEDVHRVAGTASSLGRPHIADAMIAKGYVDDRDEAFRDWLNEGRPGFVRRYACDLARGVDLVHGAAGAAVLAHPWARGADAVLTPEVITGLAREHQLEGIEVDHQDHTAAQRSLLFDLGGRLGLVRTGSSDYHGTGKKNHELGCNTTRETAYRELCRRIALRGGVLGR
jgi:predicted metal-dependent phosphoesterase TrpH